MEWRWLNDPEERRDAGHARCFAASGERWLAFGAQPFTLTTQPSADASSAARERPLEPHSTLRLEFIGLGWAQGRAERYWHSDPFTAGPDDGGARRAAGLALLTARGR